MIWRFIKRQQLFSLMKLIGQRPATMNLVEKHPSQRDDLEQNYLPDSMDLLQWKKAEL